MKVLITGASSGIGKNMALYLASMGCELYVVSRDKKKLDKIYKDIKPKVVTLEYDLSCCDNCYKLHNELADTKIDILINNAGFGDSGNFTETSLEKELEMIDLNIKAYHILTKLFLRDFTKRNRGKILNVASMAGFMPGAYMATYYATKSYIVNLSLAVAEELKQSDSRVKISIFCPGPVKTSFEEFANVKFNMSLLSAEYAARYAIDKMFDNELVIIPPNMKFNYVLTKFAPLKMTMFVSSKIQERRSV